MLCHAETRPTLHEHVAAAGHGEVLVHDELHGRGRRGEWRHAVDERVGVSLVVEEDGHVDHRATEGAAQGGGGAGAGWALQVVGGRVGGCFSWLVWLVGVYLHPF